MYVGSGPGSNSSLLLFGFWDGIFGGPGLTSGEGSETRRAGRDMRTVVKPMSECLGFHIIFNLSRLDLESGLTPDWPH